MWTGALVQSKIFLLISPTAIKNTAEQQKSLSDWLPLSSRYLPLQTGLCSIILLHNLIKIQTPLQRLQKSYKITEVESNTWKCAVFFLLLFNLVCIHIPPGQIHAIYKRTGNTRKNCMLQRFKWMNNNSSIRYNLVGPIHFSFHDRTKQMYSW